MEYKKLIKIIHITQKGQRLDLVLTKLFPCYSRSQIKKWILNNSVKLNQQITNIPKKKVAGRELVTINVPIKKKIFPYAQNIKLNIIYEDNDIIVINKPKNLVMHPGVGNNHGTVLNALLYYYPPIINVPRAGIVHRLDKDTTGLFVVAKNIPARLNLIRAIKNRNVIREYEALVFGIINYDGVIKQPISRHVKKRTHMTINPAGKPAITNYYIIKQFHDCTWLRIQLETGRTHQIRVHMSYIKHPIVGDKIYIKNFIKRNDNSLCNKFQRQALHASMLKLFHPITLVRMEWHAPLPHDMVELLSKLTVNY